MKTKKIVSLILAIIMVVGLLPMSAIAQSNAVATVLGTGSWTDKNVDPDGSYKYVVEGEDGSREVVTLLGKNTQTGNKLVPTGWKKGEIYYKRETNVNATGSDFLLVGDAGAKAQIVKGSDAKSVVLGTVINDEAKGEVIRGDYSKEEWTIGDEGGPNGYGDYHRNFKSENQNKYLIDNAGGAAVTGNYSSDAVLEVRAWGTNTFRLFKQYHYWNGDDIFVYKITDTSVTRIKNWCLLGASWDTWLSGGTQIRLYKRQPALTGDEYKIDTTELQKLIDSTANRNEFADTYTKTSWTNFTKARDEAQNAVNASKGKFYYGADAENALKNIDAKHVELLNAIKLLKLDFKDDQGNNLVVTPNIEWHRTADPKNPDYTGSVVTHITPFNTDANGDYDFSKITWGWDTKYQNGGTGMVKDLTLDGKVGGKLNTVWDYGKGDSNTHHGQLAGKGETAGISAATWHHVGNKSWPYSSARRFSGTFTWPHGYTLNDKASIVSVNDAKYQAIYDYIAEHPELQARYANSKVIPINDNMYVFISKADEPMNSWSQQQAMQHMVFWSGTDGKGIWSHNGMVGADADRTTPATFYGKPATPAYNNAWPNVLDIPGNGTNADVLNFAKTNQVPGEIQKGDATLAANLKHTDGWYTLADTSSAMSTMTGLYGADEDLGGQKMRIDIIALDNGDKGGMDELEIQFTKPDEKDVKITVDYYLKNPASEVPLGSTSFFAVEGKTIKVLPGTNESELNHMKAKASEIVGTDATVSDGRAVPAELKVSKTNNRFKVYYDAAAIPGHYFVYDFGTTTKFKLTHNEAVASASIEGSDAKINAYSEGKDIYIEYTPLSSKGTFDNAKLVINTTGNVTKKIPVNFIPASNVLYEENFLRAQESTFFHYAPWKKMSNSSVTVVEDAQSTVYGYSTAYKNSLNTNGVWKTEVTPSGDKQFSDDLVFDFMGQGFDVIGSTGPNTATLVVSVRNRVNNEVVKNFMIDTKSAKEFHQVPLVHCDGLEGGVNYSVRISAMNLEYNQPAKTYARTLKNAPADNNVAINALIEMGFTNEEIAKTEFINIDKPVSTFALRNAAPEAKAAGNKTISIDSVRVYRASDKAKNIYNDNEFNVKYTNVSSVTDASFTGYIEQAKDGALNYADYRKQGGPANEIYLMPGASLALAVSDARNDKVQVSARAVEGATSMNSVAVNHNTEMYYEVNVEGGVAVVTNTGAGMLAVANIKSPVTKINDQQKSRALMMATRNLAAPTVETFEPARFDVQLNVIKTLFNQYATLKVKTSQDVAYITVNGVKVDANNVNLQKWGIHDYMRFALRQTFKKNDAILFEVVAYDKNGNASEPVIKK